MATIVVFPAFALVGGVGAGGEVLDETQPSTVAMLVRRMQAIMSLRIDSSFTAAKQVA
jgi:hypothetical protein